MAIPSDCVEDILELYNDGIYKKSIARYLGVPLWAVQYYTDPERRREATKRWLKKTNYQKSEKYKKYQREYHRSNPAKCKISL